MAVVAGRCSAGPTLTLCFKTSKLAAGSLRLLPQDTWTTLLDSTRRGKFSVTQSTPVDPAVHIPSREQKDPDAPEALKKHNKRLSKTRGLTAVSGESWSLFLSDTTLTLKALSCEKSPLGLLEPILDALAPAWRNKCAEHYLKYVSFVRLGQPVPAFIANGKTEASAWAEDVQLLDKHFRGEAVVLGTEVPHCVYVANYLSREEVSDAFSTHVSLSGLDLTEHSRRFSEPAAPLASSWLPLHGSEPRSATSKAKMQEGFVEGQRYSGSGVFGRHYTTVSSAASDVDGVVSVETTIPLIKEAKQRFVAGACAMCHAEVVTVLEFALSPGLFLGGPAPELQGFGLLRSSQSVGTTFACSLHHYVRGQAGLNAGIGTRMTVPCSPSISAVSGEDVEALRLPVAAADLAAPAAQPARQEKQPPVVEASEPSLAPALAAELALQRRVCAQLDLPLQLLDLAAVEKQAELWRSLLPRVEPFYAVKCNPNPALVAALWQKWQDWGVGGFDCASPSEMDLAMHAGVDPAKHIVYANPCKQGSAVEHAKAAGVKWVVFDNSAELLKLKEIYPEAELLLRVQTDDSLAQCPLSNKFGAAVEDCGALLEQARHLGLQVIGVSFHVGSGCSQVGAFRSALHRARTVFDEAQRVGFNLRLLDIGGGFPGWDEAGEATFRDHAADIAEVLEELFPCPSLRVIAEPGRFFAAQSQALMTTVVSVAGSAQGNRYYLNDGVYGSFNSLIYDHAKVPKPLVLRDGKLLDDAVAGQPGACTVFGPTCDGFDLISNDLPLPQLQVGDRLLFPNMGAYTSAASTRFNGFDPATAFVYRSCCA